MGYHYVRASLSIVTYRLIVGSIRGWTDLYHDLQISGETRPSREAAPIRLEEGKQGRTFFDWHDPHAHWELQSYYFERL